jgi:hypothetical protein
MEQSFPPNNEQIELLESQLRENYGKITYSHKTQEKCADILTCRNIRLRNIQIILSALITTGLLVRIFKGAEWPLIISTILSAIQFGLVSFLREYNLGETIQKHATAALELWDIRERYLSLLTDLRSKSITISETQKRRDEMQEKLTKIYKGSPRTFSKAYNEAREALQINQELSFSDDEINKLLPANLRK